mmetsp:Transcript_54732/g.62909  ORF Transcript_54732/g.62909 Transcript_54732/m.62909 type:complete len:289 (+) Transcript_54732:22-888(+)
MPRHFPDQSVASTFFAHSDYAQQYSDRVTLGNSNHTGYHVQARGRRENYQAMKGQEALRDGFATFLSETEANEQIGDSTKKHFYVPCAVESQWRSCVHAVPAVEHVPKLLGKRFGHAPPTGTGVEFHDIPRGMKHVTPPLEKLPNEMPLFQHPRGRVINTDGINLFNAQSIPSETVSPTHAQRRHGRDGDRNGVPMKNPGDHNIAAVELSPLFFSQGQKHRLDLEPQSKPMPRQNLFVAKEASAALSKDRQDVANLPKYPKDPATQRQAGSATGQPAVAPSSLPPVKK